MTEVQQHLEAVRHRREAMGNAATKLAQATQRCADSVAAFTVAYADLIARHSAAVREFNEDALKRRGERE